MILYFPESLETTTEGLSSILRFAMNLSSSALRRTYLRGLMM